ncbi:MAG: hypothetical protein COA84_07580 [Robiginitomaculum sp.]|nr:MAG: hypothetical protein COA84_07580 [Robiginitomaculum sp.]
MSEGQGSGEEGAAGAGEGAGEGAGAGGETSPFAGLPQELADHIETTGYKSLEDLARAEFNTGKLVGVDKSHLLKIPKADQAGDPEGWGEVFKALGRPDDASGYTALPAIEGVDDIPSEAQSILFGKMHAAGANEAQVAAAHAGYAEIIQAQNIAEAAAEKAQTDEAIAALKQEFGKAYDEKIGAAQDFIKEHADESFLGFLEETKLGDNPSMVKMMAKVADMMSETPILPGGRTGPGKTGMLTPAQARAEIAKNDADPLFQKAFMDASDPNHKVNVARNLELHALAGG